MPRFQRNSTLSTAALLATMGLVIAGLYLAREVLIPFALSLLLAFLLTPLVMRLERWVGRVAAVIVVVTLSFLAIGLTGWIVAGQVIDLAGKLPTYRDNIHAKITHMRSSAGGLEKSRAVLKEIGKDLSGRPASQPTTQKSPEPAGPPETPGEEAAEAGVAAEARQDPVPVQIAEPEVSPLDLVVGYVSPVLSPLATAGIVIVFVVFFLLQREDLRDRLIRLVSNGRLNVTTQALDDAAQRISRYLLMQLVVNVTYGIPVAVGLYFIGVPNAILWGLLATVLRFLPYVGPWIAAGVPILLAFAAFDGYWHVVLTIALYIAIELVSNNVVEPWLYGASTGVSPVAIIVAAVFWTWLWGPIGLLLATPLTVCLVVIGRYVPQLEFLDVLFGDRPVLPLHMRVYQRLLAMDAEEAEQLIEEHFVGRPLAEAYDQALVPALGLAERDGHAGRLREEQQRFIREAVLAMTRKLGERHQVPPEPDPERSAGAAVLCLPAADEADEIVATMLSQVLRQSGCDAQAVPVASLVSEMVEAVEKHGSRVVCISALPPSAAAHARYLCKRLRRRGGELRLVVGLWTARADERELRRRVACTSAESVTRTLAEAAARVQPLASTLPRNGAAV